MSQEKQLRMAVVAGALGEDIREAPRRARSMGFAGLLFDAHSAALNLTELSGSGRRDFRHMLSAHDQQLAALGVEIGARGFSIGADVDRILARIERVMETAKGLGCGVVCLDAGPLPAPPVGEKPRPRIRPEEAGIIIIPTSSVPAVQEPALTPTAPSASDQSAMSHIDAAMFELGKRADRYGVMLAFRGDLAGFSAIERALAAAGCPWFGIDLDPVAILRDEWTSDEIFSKLGPLIRHVRARDALAGADRRTRPAAIGKGSTNWPELMSNLDEAGYRGWITIDPMELTDRVAAASEGIEKLRRLLA